MSRDHWPGLRDLARTRGTAPAEGASACPPSSANRKESALINKSARTAATLAVAKKVETVRAKTGWDEKILRAPADLAVILVSLATVANLGVLVLLLVIVAAIVGAIIFG